MAISIIISIVLLGVYLDCKAYRRISKSTQNKFIGSAFLSLVAVSYMLILSTPLIVYFFTSEDNSALMMKVIMASLTTYLALSLPRLLFYCIWLSSRNRISLWTAIIMSSVLFLAFIYSVFVTRIDYKVNEVELYFENLPVEFDGYRMAFISDIHAGTMISPLEELSEIKGIIDKKDVDIILFGGDIINIHHSEIDESMIVVFSELKARDGVFMVFGNHDTGAYVKNSHKVQRRANMDTLQAKMECAGWVVLRDSTVYIYRGDDSIAVTGIDYNDELLQYKHLMDALKGVDLSRIYNNVDKSVFNVTLSHLPQLWHSVYEGGFSDLTLSGHVHAMQMKIGDFSPAKFMYNEWSGLYEHGENMLYINDGIGCVGYFARIGARPEITVIQLHKK